MGESGDGIDAIARGVLDSLHEGCQVIDPSWRYVYVNDALLSQAQRARENLVGHTMMECYPGIDTTPMFVELARCMRDRTHHSMLNEFEFPNGSRGWFELRFLPVPMGLCVLSTDITKRREAELALEDSERSLRDIYATLPDAVFVVSPVGGILSANAAAGRVYGFEPHELIGREIGELIPELGRNGYERLADARSAVRRIAATEQPDLCGVRRDGTTFALDVELGPTVFRGKAAVVVVARDMTEGLKLEARLRHTQRLEALAALAGGLAHDLNNILSIILSYSELAVTGLTSPQATLADLQEIHAAGERGAELTRQLLAFGRKQVLKPRAVSLNDVVAGLERMLHRSLGADVELVVSLAADLGMVLVDPSQMEQIIVNLSVNSRDAMPRGGKLSLETMNVTLGPDSAVEGATRAHLEPGRYVVLSASDTGIGFSDEVRAHLFEPFFTTKEVGRGTGLGLATVFGIVQQSGGYITVQSERDRGTTFKIFLPRIENGSVAPPPPDDSASVILLYGTETILLVEYDDHVRALARTILEKYGYNVLDARSGGDALLIAEEQVDKIDLLLTDVVMPRMSGRQLADRLEKVRPGLKVLFMSGYDDGAIAQHGVSKAGMSHDTALRAPADFLEKPITPEALARKIRALLDSE
ncbi:MAG: PAS domain-containing protein [Polyangiaceae bacterium]